MTTKRGVTYNADGTIAECIFCKINTLKEQHYQQGCSDLQQVQQLQADPLTQGTLVLAESKDFIVFQPRDPQAQSHLLVVPKQHINDITTLTKKDVALVEQMVAIGYYIMQVEDKLPSRVRIEPSASHPIEAPLQIDDSKLEPYSDLPADSFGRGWVPTNGFRYVFHRPPFHSIGHLHLHVQRLPYTTYRGMAEFATGSWWCKDATDLIRELKLMQ